MSEPRRTAVRPVLLLVLVLVLLSGSAYAAQSLARDSVRSPQVKNNSLVSQDLKNGSVRGGDLRAGTLTGREVRDGSLGAGDLAPGAFAETEIVIKRITVAEGAVTFFERPELGTLTFSCGGGNSIGMLHQVTAAAVPAQVFINGSDVADNNPVGAAAITAPAGTAGGGAGFGGGGNLIPQGNVYVVTQTQSLHVDWSASTGDPCTVRAHITIDEVDGTDFFAARAVPGRPATCDEVTGAATCRIR